MRNLVLTLFAVCMCTTAPAVDSLDFGDHEWINSEPLTAQSLKGKMAVVRFYEESCPSCRATWTAINQSAVGWKKDKHLILIAVNSGTAKGQVQGYAQAVKLDNWRVLVDTDRAYEKKFGFTISLQNIYQAVFIAPDGSITPINAAEPNMSQDIQRMYDQHKDQVKWKIAPADVPAPAQDLWQAYELEQWSVVNQKLAAAQRSTDVKVKEFGVKIDTGVKEVIAARLAAAKEKLDAGDKWAAFKLYEAVMADFGMRAETKEASAQAGKLRSDRKVTLEFTGRDVYRKGLAMYADPNQKKQGEVYLQSVIDNYKDTEAAQAAKKALGK